ncbi:MAG: gamma-glutamyltransferase [Pseudomonadota bacterium]
MTGMFAIAAGHRLTAEAGAEVLRAGGSAVDAVVAGAAMAMVAEPVLAGLCGGGFLMMREAGGRMAVLDAFVETPRAKRGAGDCDLRDVEADFGTARQRFRIGAGTIAASGLAAGLVEAHARDGRMALPELLAPAARAARDGVELTPFQARLGGIVAPIVSASPEVRALFCNADGAPLAAGARAANPALGDVLEVFGLEGARFVQEGEVAAAVLALARDGGHLQAADLAGYQPHFRAPLLAERCGVQLALNPPPALGGALTAFPLAILPQMRGRMPDALSLARAFELTLEARAGSGIDADAEAGAARLGDTAALEVWRARLEAVRGASGGAARRGTTHISAVDRDGAAAALTLSNGEGCGLIAPGTGIMPNNMLGEDDLVPGDPLGWVPGRRLASMMTPMIAAWPDGRVMALGSGGSNRIRTALAQVMLALTDGGADLEQAIAAPRLHVEGCAEDVGEAAREARAGSALQLDFERPGRREEEIAALERAYPGARGWEAPSMFFGGVHAVMRESKGGAIGVGDARRSGYAIAG